MPGLAEITRAKKALSWGNLRIEMLDGNGGQVQFIVSFSFEFEFRYV